MRRNNVGDGDRLARIAVGLALLAMLFALDSTARWYGLVGIIPLATALTRWCPLYALLGLNTLRIDGEGAPSVVTPR